jgi:threonine dehydratase
VVGVSGGNHAQGLAYAARSLGLKATICMPATTPRNYLEATRGYGAEIVLCPDIVSAFAEGRRLRDLGMAEVHPFDDPFVAAGQGTVGLEILEDLPDVSTVFVSIGGGGLISGVATALRRQRPDIRVIGVETAGADAMARSIAAGGLIDMPAITSIARTLGAPRVSEFTLAHVRSLVEEVVVVDDAEAFSAMKFVLERAKILAEPAAACCLAAARRRAGSFRAGEKVVILLCGGNASLDDMAQ